MPWVGFEPTIPAFERAKTVHVLDRAANVIGISVLYKSKFVPVLNLGIEWLILRPGHFTLSK
jgi:hypothetical protein